MPDNAVIMNDVLGITPSEAREFLRQIEPAVMKVQSNAALDDEDVVLPGGFYREFLVRAPDLRRALVAMYRSNLLEGDQPLTAGELLGLKGVGPVTVRKLVLTVEGWFQSCAEASPDSGDNLVGGVDIEDDEVGFFDDWVPIKEGGPSFPEAVEMFKALGESSAAPSGPEPHALSSEMVKVLATARELHRELRFFDVFHPCVQRIAEAMGHYTLEVDQLSAFSGPGLIEMVATAAWNEYKGLSLARRTIVDHRIVASPGKDLARVAEFLGWSEKRVIEVQVELEVLIEGAMAPHLDQLVTILLREMADNRTPPSVFFEAKLTTVFAQFASVGHSLARYFLQRRLDAETRSSPRFEVVSRSSGINDEVQ